MLAVQEDFDIWVDIGYLFNPYSTMDHKETLRVNHSRAGIAATLLVYSPLLPVVILILSYNLSGY
jgi:hypothetical protein